MHPPKSDRFVNFILRAPTGAASRIRVLALRTMGMSIGRRCRLSSVDISRNPWDVELADGVALDRGVVLLTTGERLDRPRLRIGPGTYVNRNTMFDASVSITVGANVMIGPLCYVTDHDHGTAQGHPVGQMALVEAPVIIEDNVWLGAGVVVLKGVTISRDAVIGAGSVVTRDVPPGARYVGVPARARVDSGSSA